MYLTSEVSAETPSLGNVPAKTMLLFPSQRMHYFLYLSRRNITKQKQIK